MTAKNKSEKKTKKTALYYSDQNKDQIGEAHEWKWGKKKKKKKEFFFSSISNVQYSFPKLERIFNTDD